MEGDSVRTLVQAALNARQSSYAPYSGYTVGAALYADSGKMYTGCNIENASYGATNCAERTAVFKAVSDGEQRIRAIAVAGGMQGQEPVNFAYPCGICRQVMQEFGGGDMQVIVAKSLEEYQIFTLREFLPLGFGGESIQ